VIAKLTGTLDSKGADWAVVDVGGVGYLVYCSTRTLDALPAPGGTISLLVDTHVREDHIHLYGFETALERDWFRLLMTVQGVGAKVALGLISVFAADDLVHAVAAKDTAALTRAPGVGKKLAQRLVSELADKIGDVAPDPVIVEFGKDARAGGDAESRVTADAVSALVNLGYGRADAFAAVARTSARLGGDAEIDALIRGGLAELSGADQPAVAGAAHD
jgi:Holliday junction DNA helicase RuvA